MKKHYLLISLWCIMANAQVGIGTTSPNAQLDIESTTNGILIPRVALSSKALSAPVVNPNGGGAPADATLVYNIATAGADADAVVPGYYYYNAASSRWIQLSTALALTDSATNRISGTEIQRTALTGDITAAANSNATTITDNAVTTTKLADFAVTNGKIATSAVSNAKLGSNSVTSPKISDGTIVNVDLDDSTGGIYKGSGSLPTNTVVTANIPADSRLVFSPAGGLANQFSVDGSTFSIDTDKNFVGIGTQTPSYKLHVRGDTNVKGRVRIESAGTGEYAGFIEGSEEVVGDEDKTSLIIQSSRGGGNMIFNTNAGSSIIEAARITNVGRLGLGTTAPTSTFHNNGTTSLTISPTSSSTTDTTVLLRNANFSLPTPSAGLAGRIYTIRNTTTSTITISGSIIPYNSTTAGNFSLTSAISSISVICDGTNWYRIE